MEICHIGKTDLQSVSLPNRTCRYPEDAVKQEMQCDEHDLYVLSRTGAAAESSGSNGSWEG